MDQSDYIVKLLLKFGMQDSNCVSTPMELNCKLTRQSELKLTSQPFREVLGSIMYLMLATRPDLCFALGYPSRFQDCATDVHWNHLKRILRYLRGSKEMRLVYKRGNAKPLIGYVDADWANDVDERKSTTGFIFQVFGNTVVWSSKKQGLVAMSTTEAEYVAASTATSEAIWLTTILEDLRIDSQKPITLFEDNAGCIFVARNPETRRSKHIEVKYHCLRDHVMKKNIELLPVSSKDQVQKGVQTIG